MSDPVQALCALDALTHRLRNECPWDREQDERSIVPHTVEEAYELADAANRGDDAKLLDELGDMLFQVLFLALLLEERGAGDLEQVAEHCAQKLIRRHPHVFGDTHAANANEVLRNWDAIKATEPGRERGVFGEVPENLPALSYARKLQQRAVSAGVHRPMLPASREDRDGGLEDEAAIGQPRPTSKRPQDKQTEDQESFRAIGERLLALVDEARLAHVDPELALRAAAQRYRETIETEELYP